MSERIIKFLNNSWPVTLGLLIGLYFISFQIIGLQFNFFPGDLGDGRFCNYILEHAYKYFTFQIDYYWGAPFMVPEANVISYSENLVGSAPIYSAFRIMGFDRETSYQWWFIAISAINYICCYLFLFATVKNKYTAVIGAFIFAFSIGLQSQMTHAQTFPRFAIPLAFWMGIRFFRNFQLKDLFLMTFFSVYQMYCSIYLGFMNAIPIAIFLLLILAYRFTDFITHLKNIKWTSLFIGTFIINSLLLLPLLLPYLERSTQLGVTDYASIFPTIPLTESFLYSQKGSLVWDLFNTINTELTAPWDHQIFPGGIAILSIITFYLYLIFRLIKRKTIDKITLILFITSIITFLLFIRTDNYSLFSFINKLPGFGALRSITRIINIELLFFAFATTFVLNILFGYVKKYQSVLFIGFVCLVAADNYIIEGQYRTDKVVAQNRVNNLIRKMQHIPQGDVISYEPTPLTSASFEYQIDAMLAAQSLNLKTINGYTSTSPAGYGAYWEKLDEQSRIEWLTKMQLPVNSVHVIK